MKYKLRYDVDVKGRMILAREDVIRIHGSEKYRKGKVFYMIKKKRMGWKTQKRR